MAEPDWADEYDPTNPDGPPPKNLSDMAPSLKPPGYDPIRTNLGPVGYVPGAPQVDPLPYAIPPNMHPNMEIRNDEGPFFTQSNRRAGQSNATRDINDYLQKMLPPAATKVGSPYRTLDNLDQMTPVPVGSPVGQLLAPDSMVGPAYRRPDDELSRGAGIEDIDRYHRTFHMPNFSRDERLAKDNSDFDDATSIRGMPDYMQKDTAAQLVHDAMDSKMEQEVVWEGKTAPTQGDIDKVKANPTDGMYQMFEDQFGADATAKAFPMDEEEEPVPLPKPRPKSAPKRK